MRGKGVGSGERNRRWGGVGWGTVSNLPQAQGDKETRNWREQREELEAARVTAGEIAMQRRRGDAQGLIRGGAAARRGWRAPAREGAAA